MTIDVHYENQKLYCNNNNLPMFASQRCSHINSWSFNKGNEGVLQTLGESLIEKYGWYKAKNRGDNLNGVSRDHMLSVNEGFNMKIDPYLISHPANCKLMVHTDNVSKHKKSSITKEDLIERINSWDKKYSKSGL